MRTRIHFFTVAGCLAMGLLAAVAAGTVRSGPQVGAKVPGAFAPLNVTGPDAGKKSCLFCRFGMRPVVMIFARQVSPELVGLLKRVNAVVASDTEGRLGSFAVNCNNADDLPAQLARLAKQEELKQIILATFDAAGPARYQINPEADVTVVLYRRAVVQANYGFKKGEWGQKEVEKILADLPKILKDQ